MDGTRGRRHVLGGSSVEVQVPVEVSGVLGGGEIVQACDQCGLMPRRE